MGAALDRQAVLELLAHQRACRRFRADPIDDEAIATILTGACRAPSAENAQPWVFVVVRDPKRRAAIWALAERAWTGGGRQAAEHLPDRLLEDVDGGLTGGFARAPITIVVGADHHRGRAETAASSVFPAIQNLLITATAFGLGSALTTIATAFSTELAGIVEFPDHVHPLAVIPLGRPARPLGPSRREPFEDHTYRDSCSEPW